MASRRPATEGRFPRDRVITVYGRMPVLEALRDPRARVAKVLVARTARGDAIDQIVAAAAERRVRVERCDAQRVTRISRNGRHDQGVVADVASPGLASLDEWLEGHTDAARLLLLDGVTNPANVGMVIRTAVAAGLDGVVLPAAGTPEVGPLVVKASAGVALSAPVLRAPTAAAAAVRLQEAGVAVVGLGAKRGTALWEWQPPPRVALVLGSETTGVSPEVAAHAAAWVSIPLCAGVDSLNVAAAAAVVAFDLARRAATPVRA